MFANTVGTYWTNKTKHEQIRHICNLASAAHFKQDALVSLRLAAKRSRRSCQQILCCFAEWMSLTSVTPPKLKSRFFFLHEHICCISAFWSTGSLSRLLHQKQEKQTQDKYVVKSSLNHSASSDDIKMQRQFHICNFSLTSTTRCASCSIF